MTENLIIFTCFTSIRYWLVTTEDWLYCGITRTVIQIKHTMLLR